MKTSFSVAVILYIIYNSLIVTTSQIPNELEVLMSPRVSVIIPTYNRAYIIEKSVQSVLNQTYTDFELIIVDDGSKDNTAEVLAGIIENDNRVKMIRTPGNLGAAGARNFGIGHAVGELIAFEDSDDFWVETKLEKCVSALDKVGEEYGFAYHKIRYDMSETVRQQTGDITAQAYAILPDENLSDDKKSGDIYAQLLYENMVDCPSMVIRKTLLDEIGLFDTSLKALEDYDLALRMAKVTKACFVSEVLLDSTYSQGGVSLNATNYLTASCMLIGKFKADYLATNTLNHRLETILNDSKAIGMQEQYVGLLEKILQM